MHAVASPEAAARSQAFMESLRQWASLYASAELPVVPLHSPKKIGICDCPLSDKCDSPAKHPRTLRGFKDATCDDAIIERWWNMWPRSNIGIAIPHNFAVLDIDGPEGLEALADHGWNIPTTPSASTGKGWHYWFRTKSNLPPRAHMLTKVDLRGPGSYVVAPPSLHISGKQYIWLIQPTDMDFQEAPEWLVELATHSGVHKFDNSHVDTEKLFTDGINEGERDSTLFRVAAKLCACGVPQDVAEGVIAVLAGRCVPEFDVDKAIAKVSWTYSHYTMNTWQPKYIEENYLDVPEVETLKIA